MTNKELISYEGERLEDIRQGLINFAEETGTAELNEHIKELGEISYELTAKIKDEKRNKREKRFM